MVHDSSVTEDYLRCTLSAAACCWYLLRTLPHCVENYSEKLSMAYNEIKGGGKTAPSDDKAAKKAQKEKTFWEKNWMFVLAGAMLLFNLVAGKPPPTAQQGRAQR